MSDPHTFEHNPRMLAAIFYVKAKRLWCASLTLKLVAPLLGIFFVLRGANSTFSPILVFFLATASELLQWRSDTYKSSAENLTRKIEYHNGFGWSFSEKDLRDGLSRISAKLRNSIALSIEDNYFASKSEAGPKRAIENLLESARWTSHLSGAIIWVYSIGLGFLIGGSILTLSRSISDITNQNTLGSINKVVTAVLSLIITLGFIKLLTGYVSFKMKADQVDQAGTVLLKAEQIKEMDAVRLLHEYQLSRASAPLIPDIVWALKQEKLNEILGKYSAA